MRQRLLVTIAIVSIASVSGVILSLSHDRDSSVGKQTEASFIAFYDPSHLVAASHAVVQGHLLNEREEDLAADERGAVARTDQVRTFELERSLKGSLKKRLFH